MTVAGSSGRNLGDRAYDEVKARIVRCTYAPGRLISERAVADDLELGLAPIRSAFSKLAGEGLLTAIPRRGYRVATLTVKTADDLLAAWKLIGAEVARLATANMTPARLAEYNTLTRRLEADGPADQIDAALSISRGQWRFLLEVAGNDYLADLCERLSGELDRVLTIAFIHDPDMRQQAVSAEHETTMNRLFRTRDADRCAELTAAFIERARAEVLTALRATPAVQSVRLAP